MAWKLSVAERIPQFKRGRRVDTTLTGAVGPSATVLSLNTTGLDRIFSIGDIVRLGPSSNASFLGRTESRRVLSATTSTLTLSSGLVNAYSVGDKIVGTGMLVADGWLATTYNSPNFTLTSRGLAVKAGATGIPEYGYANILDYISFAKTAGTTGTAALTWMSKDVLLASVPYRGGVVVRKTGYSGPAPVTLFSMDSVQNDNTMYVSTSGGVDGTWYAFEGINSCSVDVTGAFGIQFQWSATTAFTKFDIGLVYLTHASGTDGMSAGVYSFPEDPVAVQSILRSRSKVDDLDYGSIQIGSFENTPLREYRLTFDSVDATFVRNLEMFEYWQQQGCRLMLESDAAYEVPLFGYMTFDWQYSHWDDNILTVSMSFVGE